MSSVNYDASLKRVLVHEGGYTNEATDPGGPTNYGITIFDVRKYLNPDADADDVKNITVAQAKVIYAKHYGEPVRFNPTPLPIGQELPSGVDYAVFDYGINSGISRAIKVLQRLCNVEDDGDMGPVTLAEANKRDPSVLVNAICDERMKFLQGLKIWPTYKNGWSRRVKEVREASVAFAGQAKMVVPTEQPEKVAGQPPWLDRANALLGLYEFPGGSDNPAILAMAKACGGKIASTYQHDSIAWCALFVNYCLLSSGQKGDDSLWALDFRNYGNKLDGPAVGAIATKTREGGGHVFFVVGRSATGKIVGRGGNQSDMVKDELFDPDVLRYNWPMGYAIPATGFNNLPVVAPASSVKKDISSLPAPTQVNDAKGEVTAPNPTGPAAGGGAVAGGAAAFTWWNWLMANPLEAGLIAAGGVLVIAAIAYGARQWFKKNKEKLQVMPTPNVEPVHI